jgi:hypothetical protein
MLRKILAAGAIAMTLATGHAIADETARNAGWDGILQTYVVESDDGVNRFQYGALKASAADTLMLNDYIESFAALDLDALTPDAHFAALANAYNALTIQHLIQRYPTKSIRSGYIFGPWKRVKMVIDGETLSLDDIEHNVLRKDFDDPRVHYAVNCASYGCPNLQNKAWVGETLDADLNEAARDFINHPRGVTVRARGGLQVSEIYKWFKEDFGGNEQGVIAHLLEYAEPELATQIKANADIKTYEYDWSLNDAK